MSTFGKFRKITAEGVVQAIRMYEAGENTHSIAQKFSVRPAAIWSLLKNRGVAMRPIAKGRTGDSCNFFKGGGRSHISIHHAVHKAVKDGVLKRSEACERCGELDCVERGRHSLHAHHDDYNYPLVVRWLCRSCHQEWHKTNFPNARCV